MEPIQIMILQHPQEKQEELNTVPLIEAVLQNRVEIKIGLSWPNLVKNQTKQWGVLYLGSSELPKEPGLYEVSKKTLKPYQPNPKIPLIGLILLDGTWSQAKSLWWRNAWLLKCCRFALKPQSVSFYGKLRKEPRLECLSTLESLAYTLTCLGEPQETEKKLIAAFKLKLQTLGLGPKPF